LEHERHSVGSLVVAGLSSHPEDRAGRKILTSVLPAILFIAFGMAGAVAPLTSALDLH
jgi:hypothetical protein